MQRRLRIHAISISRTSGARVTSTGDRVGITATRPACHSTGMLPRGRTPTKSRNQSVSSEGQRTGRSSTPNRCGGLAPRGKRPSPGGSQFSAVVARDHRQRRAVACHESNPSVTPRRCLPVPAPGTSWFDFKRPRCRLYRRMRSEVSVRVTVAFARTTPRIGRDHRRCRAARRVAGPGATPTSVASGNRAGDVSPIAYTLDGRRRGSVAGAAALALN